MCEKLNKRRTDRRFTNTANKIVFLFISIFILLASAPNILAAEEAGQAEGWQFNVAPYMWAAGMGGTTASVGDIDIEFSDIWDNLDIALMGVFGARKGKWSFLTDVIYLNVEDDDQGTLTVPVASGISLGTDAGVDLKGWIVTPAVGYTVIETEKARIDIVAGVRYFWLESDIKVTISGPLQSRRAKFSDSGDVWDGIVGARGQVNLADKWYLPYHLDIGTGESELTWQALAGVGYKFNRFDVVMGYRYMEWNFDDSDVFDDLNLSGPYIGFKFVF